jgi:hypothetical protein
MDRRRIRLGQNSGGTGSKMADDGLAGFATSLITSDKIRYSTVYIMFLKRV